MKEMLEITIDACGENLLKSAGFDNVMTFCCILSYGNIKYLENYKVKLLKNVTIPINSQIEKLKSIKEKQIRIWYSSLDNEDMCSLYFLISYFYNKNIDIFICDIANKEHFSFSSYISSEIKELSKNTILLNNKEKRNFKKNWDKLVKENNDLRVLNNGKLMSSSFDYLDSKIINLIKTNKNIEYLELVGKCVSEKLCGFYIDLIFMDRIDELISKGKVKIFNKDEKHKYLMITAIEKNNSPKNDSEESK